MSDVENGRCSGYRRRGERNYDTGPLMVYRFDSCSAGAGAAFGIMLMSLTGFRDDLGSVTTIFTSSGWIFNTGHGREARNMMKITTT